MEIATDGNVSAHRAILMARSDVMKAMFTRDFRESRSRSVGTIIILHDWQSIILAVCRES